MYNKTTFKNSDEKRITISPFENKIGHFQAPPTSYYNTYKSRGGSSIYSFINQEPINSSASQVGLNPYIKTNPIGTHHQSLNKIQYNLICEENQKYSYFA